VEDVRLQLIESARNAFYDYFLIFRSIAVNVENLALLKNSRESADSRFRVGKAPAQEVIQMDVEIGRQQERRVILERMRKVAIARINTLMNLAPDSPLPPPPEQLSLGGPLLPVQDLRALALAQRPDIQALNYRLVADQASLSLAQREFYPDFEVLGAYDTIMGNGPMRDLAPQVGVRMNLPIRCKKRFAALDEARSRIAQRHAELEKQIAQVNFQVQEAYEQVVESEAVVRLYQEKILPAATSN